MAPPPSLPSHPLSTTTLSTTQLSNSPHLPALYTLINLAFGHAHQNYRTVLLAEHRLHSPAQILEELGPAGFCILAFAASDTDTDSVNVNVNGGKPGKLIATASAKPYTPPGTEPVKSGSTVSEINRLFKRTRGAEKEEEEEEEEGGKPTQQPVLAGLSSSSEAEDGGLPLLPLPTWEILAMSVDPEVQGRGIAARMLGFTIEEIRRRIGEPGWGKDKDKEEEVEVGKGEWKGKVKILLSTMKELNEGYYQRKGWRTTAERRFEAGVGGSEAGFGVVDMVKVVG